MMILLIFQSHDSQDEYYGISCAFPFSINDWDFFLFLSFFVTNLYHFYGISIYDLHFLNMRYLNLGFTHLHKFAHFNFANFGPPKISSNLQIFAKNPNSPLYKEEFLANHVFRAMFPSPFCPTKKMFLISAFIPFFLLTCALQYISRFLHFSPLARLGI